MKVGDRVKWNWGSGEGEGEIVEVYTEKITRTIKGAEVTRNATKDEPAFLIKQDDGDRVLKSASELHKG
jgi:ribosomal protein L24